MRKRTSRLSQNNRIHSTRTTEKKSESWYKRYDAYARAEWVIIKRKACTSITREPAKLEISYHQGETLKECTCIAMRASKEQQHWCLSAGVTCKSPLDCLERSECITNHQMTGKCGKCAQQHIGPIAACMVLNILLFIAELLTNSSASTRFFNHQNRRAWCQRAGDYMTTWPAYY